MMKKYKITWSPKARGDLDNIHFYIEYYLKEKNTANNIVKKLLNLIANLKYLPERYTKIQSFKDKTKNIHRMLVNNYVVIYEINENTRASFHLTYFSQFTKLFKSIINYIKQILSYFE